MYDSLASILFVAIDRGINFSYDSSLAGLFKICCTFDPHIRQLKLLNH